MSKLKKISPKTNTLYRGDNLEILKAMPENTFDVCYIDPPFFTQKNYKNIWGDKESVLDWESSRLDGFFDTRDFFEQHIKSGEKGLRAYLEWMRLRLAEIHRVLKPGGYFFCHLDYHAVHYIKIVLDDIYGYNNFVNQIIWKRVTNNKAQTEGSFAKMHDTILCFQKTPVNSKNFNKLYLKGDANKDAKNYPYTEEKTGRQYGSFDFTQKGQGPARKFNGKLLTPPSGKHWIWGQDEIDKGLRDGTIIFTKNGTPRVKRYLDEKKGNLIGDIWNDDLVQPIQANSKEKTGWPTQKPVALLQRIISACSNENGLILDCFAGCGTTMHAAHLLKRKWVGIDISPTAMKVNKKRLEEINAKVTIIDEKDLDLEIDKIRNSKKAA
ncbi:hypothetical protein AZI85_17230 [Bdellovibrio bacteriovorus]|uniref:Methyltransferase n=1 Tax=Bdellovibrio bacteriovorus TaxID=959 RepID=A0A150WTA4_BDEBC|nr:site-specific DNA-methyltransferase [Bdellovibrio bacteriovorus]KYG67622.1 hypothetical protein AZI85_17230 [Bdellovibrio bacteriovorus]